MRNLLLLVPLFALGCLGAVEVRPPPSGHPHSRGPSRMSQSEAISAGRAYCRDRGYRCDLKQAHLAGNDRWKVKFEASRGDARGKLHLEFDAWSRRLRDVDENVKVRGRGRDDDRHRGRGHGKGKGHAKHH